MSEVISRDLLGKIVDEVFGGAIEDACVIAEIYAVIKREEATLSAAEPVKPYGYVYESTVRYCDGRGPHRKVDFFHTKKNISDDDIEEFEISETAVYDRPPHPAPSVAVMALRPFAEKADRYNEIPGLIRFNDNVELWQVARNRGMEIDITVGDLRRAREAYSALSARVQDVSSVVALADAAYDLASWAGCINWRGGENQKEWLDDLRHHIATVQSLCKQHRTTPTASARQEGGSNG
ncbi:hypothetical protein [Agrobacterium sp. P15N1-A]|uniref:hypothetical protein n=1 Tax=Agrobacterium sp. P15N1-A TaxID=3342820 RepID=UPI0037D71DC8